jgi:uncharacterized protein (TIGR02145 family)
MNRYWVGNGTVWSSVSSWSDTSGGISGSTVPLSTDDVFFNASSGNAVVDGSTSTCNNLNCVGFSGSLYGDHVVTPISVYGSLTLSSTMLITQYVGLQFRFRGNSTSRTITTANQTLSYISFDMTGGDITLLDNVTCNQQFHFGNGGGMGGGMIGGTVYANGNTINSLSQGFACITVLGGTFDISNSIMNINYQFRMSPNLNVITTNSKINVSGGLIFNGGDKSFNVITNSGGLLKIKGNLITDTLTIAGTSTLSRALVKSDIDGTQCTITAENIIASNVNFQDINLQGNCVKDLSAILGGAQDLGNNSNIRFSPSLKKKGRQLGYNIGSKQGSNGVQIGDQIWSAKNYNESTVGSLVIPEVQNANNVDSVVNGSFTTDTSWAKSRTNVTINGTLNFNSSSPEFAYQNGWSLLNRWYKITYTILNYVSGSVTFRFGSNNYGTARNSNGTYVEYIKCGDISLGRLAGLFTLYAGTVNLSVDNLSCELIGWTNSTTLYDARILAGYTVDQACAAAAMWCNYNNLQSNGDIYGKMYNQYAVNAINSQLILINSDWRVPLNSNFTTLITYLGGNSVAGGKMKELGLSHWYSPNLKGDNSSGYNALPAGYRNSTNGTFGELTQYGYFGTLDSYVYIGLGSAAIFPHTIVNQVGHSLRLIKK